MGKSVSVFCVFILFYLIFAGFVHAQEKGKSRVVYEENTSFEDAKRRAKIVSEMKAQNSQGEDASGGLQLATGDNSQAKQLPADSLKQNIMSLLEKVLGKDAAGLLSGYKGRTTKDPESMLEEQVVDGKAGDGTFREFPDESYKWKGLRQEQVGGNGAN